MPYKIQLRYFYGGDDAGWTEESDGEIKAMRFANIEQAPAALDELFAEVKAAVAAGDMDTEEVRDGYRITAATA